MNYLIDIFILLIIAIFTFAGYKKGLIKVAFKLISFFLSIFIAITIYKPFSNFIINNTQIDEHISQTIYKRLSSSDITTEEQNNIISSYYSNIKNSSVSYISDNISKSIVNIGCVLVVFVASNIILLIFKFSGDLIAKLPIIHQVNTIGGFIYGLLKGFLIVYIILAICSIIAPIIDINNIINIINSSIIANIMYNNNIIFILFS